MSDKPKLSVEDILAACRTADGAGGAAAGDEVPAAKSTGAAPASAAAPEKPSAEMSVADIIAAAKSEKKSGPAGKPAAASAGKPAPASAAKKPGEMSMAEILAAARGEKSAAAAPKAKAAAAAPAQKAAAQATKKESPKPAAGRQPGLPKETSSILAAARKTPKPGPMSKAEAAARQKSGVEKAPARRVVPPLPEKPAYARPKPVAAGDDASRRSFFSLLFGSFLAIGFVSLGAVSALWGLGLARFMFPNILTEPPSRFKVGFPDDFPGGSVSTKFKAQFGVWVVSTEFEGQPMITALKTVCTHLGCTPNWLEGEQKFKCPCHGSGFYKDGINFEGPAPRPLERYAIRVADDGQLEIDKSKTFQQELGQWSDSASYVTV